MNRAKSQRRFVFACLAPAVILVALFMFWPTVNVFRMSLYRMGGITNRKEFIGLQNFKTLMEDKNFLEAMQNTILIIVMVMKREIQGEELFPRYFLHTEHSQYRCNRRYFWRDL